MKNKPDNIIDTTGMERNVWLEISFREFMEKLQDDIQTYLGPKVPFMLRLDVKIGVEPKNEGPMRKYESRLSKLLNSMPTIIQSGSETKPVLDDISKIPLAPEMKTPEEDR